MARVEHAVEINATPEAVYAALLQFDAYPSFVQDLRRLQRTGERSLQGQVGHGEAARSFDAEITEQIPASLLALRIVHGLHYEMQARLHGLYGPSGPARTRVVLTVQSAPHEQVLAVHGDAESALRARIEHDMARLKTHLETAAHQAGAAHPRHVTAPVTSAAAGSAAPGVKPAARTEGSGFEHERPLPGSRGIHDWLRQPPSMAELWDFWQQPWRTMRSVTRDVGRVVNGVLGSGQRSERGAPNAPGARTAWSPAVETAQRGQQFVVCAEVPGVRCEELQVEIKHDRLTIEGERHPEPQHGAGEERRSERSYGHFYRVVALPPGARADAASAALHNGVLEITVPLEEIAQRPRRLEVRPR
ncbi:MAG TPA: Hsp20 family protein [Noviherbaspirillum sp.]